MSIYTTANVALLAESRASSPPAPVLRQGPPRHAIRPIHIGRNPPAALPPESYPESVWPRSPCRIRLACLSCRGVTQPTASAAAVEAPNDPIAAVTRAVSPQLSGPVTLSSLPSCIRPRSCQPIRTCAVGETNRFRPRPGTTSRETSSHRAGICGAAGHPGLARFNSTAIATVCEAGGGGEHCASVARRQSIHMLVTIAFPALHLH